MKRTGLLLVILAAPVAAQRPAPPEPIRFETKWDASDSQVRIRPAGDTAAPWTIAHARREDSWTFEVVPDRGRPLPVNATDQWVVDVRVREWELRDRNEFRGAMIGGVLAAAAYLAATRAPTRQDRTGIALMIPYIPASAAAGMFVGRILGGAIPVHEWQRATIVR